MIVAAHPPAYLPWLGYLDRLAKADLFVVLDDLAYQPRSCQDSSRIRLSDRTGWLTVPGDRICDPAWQRDSWRRILDHYAEAPFFDCYSTELCEVYTRPWSSIVDLDIHILSLARRWFDIDTPFVLASDLALVGTGTSRVIDMCKKVGATGYLAHPAADLEVSTLRRANLDVKWHHFDHPIYEQCYPERSFDSHLGFIDLLLNHGEAAQEMLFEHWSPAPARAMA